MIEPRRDMPRLRNVPKYREWTPLLVFGGVAWSITLLVGAAIVLTISGMPVVIPIPVGIGLLYGWVLYAFVRYRHSRQDELRQLLTSAVESQAPLAAALKAYVKDRPHGPVREFWVALLLFPVLPGYYWLWHRERT